MRRPSFIKVGTAADANKLGDRIPVDSDLTKWETGRQLMGSNGGSFSSMSPVSIALIVGSVSVVCVLLLLLAIAAYCVRRKRKKNETTAAAAEGGRRRRRRQQKMSNSWRRGSKLFRVESSKVFDPSLESISMRELVKATENFDHGRVIGDGGFGLVYEAALKDGRKVAIKRLAYGGMQGQREFEAEMETLGSIKHPNLVELLAYSQLGEDRLLVYEFAENGSLDRWLHDGGGEGGAAGIGGDGAAGVGCSCALDWRRRLRIASDAAAGILYLHDDCIPNIIHRDIKSSNILLGARFEAKIADFGLARLMSPFVSHVSTDTAGTIGYMAPEYCLAGGGATKKADVYSFGMVLLELATKRRPDTLVQEDGMKSLASWAATMAKHGRHMELLDPCLLLPHKRQDSGGAAAAPPPPPPPSQEVLAYIQIACDCVHESPRKRPTMKEVLDRLSSLPH